MAVKCIILDYFGVIHNGRLDNKTLELMNKLAKKYVVGVLSNSASRYLELDGLDFEPVIVTPQDAGYIKPQLEMYRYILKQMKLKPEETVFVDDIEINVIAAEKVGIKGLLYDNVYKLSKDLTDLGVEL